MICSGRFCIRAWIGRNCQSLAAVNLHSTLPVRHVHNNSSEEPAADDDTGPDADIFHDSYLRPSAGHKVCVVQPALSSHGSSRHDRARLQLMESCALVDSLPGWRVLDKEIFHLKSVDGSFLFSRGIFSRVSEWLKGIDKKTAVFVNVSLLSTNQLKTLQRAWSVPVYDRFTIVLQIFHIRASSQEAKMQVALSEIPYYKSRLRGMHDGILEKQKGGLQNIGGSGETFFETRQRLLSDKEASIRRKLDAIRGRRDMVRQRRKKQQIPVVALVGYTNAGKTSLIKALTGAKSLQPKDQLFATLDVTSYTGYLGNHMKVLFLDTIGFISDIPTSLVQSFRAVLEDIAGADVIVHVADVSHPDSESQRALVEETLREMSLPETLMAGVIQVANKVDLVHSDTTDNDGVPSGWVPVSATTRLGLSQLQNLIEGAVIQSTGRLRKRFKIPLSGSHLTWLYREVTVVRCLPCTEEADSVLVDVVLTPSAYAQFRAKYDKKVKTH